MESLGGDQAWFDRFLAEHAAVLYYWLLIAFYLVSPKVAYNFMQRVEHHAADTYCEFLESNRELLASIPPPVVALNYYRNQDLYLFDSFQTSSKASGVQRRPDCNTLLDVFIN
ncbi:ubiquinol oxidase, partial [Haematococcus lacustris]